MFSDLTIVKNNCILILPEIAVAVIPLKTAVWMQNRAALAKIGVIDG
jgi:hypothetical protein